MTRKQLVKMVSDFLTASPMAVLSTSDRNGKAESALIAFANNAGLELFFETDTSSRKYKNLQKKPDVALVIGWDAAVHLTIQYEGSAHEISGSELEQGRRILLAKKLLFPSQFINHSHTRLFKVTPSWIRWADYRSYPPVVQELEFKKDDLTEM